MSSETTESLPPEAPSTMAMIAAELREILATESLPKAERITGPHALAAETLGKLFSVDKGALEQSLEAAALEINGGSLTGVEGTLASQAATLNGIFHQITQFVFAEARTADDFSTYLKLALRAQSQCASALEILANTKQGPRVIIAKQLNAANQQVVNNGSLGTAATEKDASCIVRSAKSKKLPRARESSSFLLPQSPLRHAPLDSRRSRKTTPDDPTVATMDQVHRPRHGNRKAKEQP